MKRDRLANAFGRWFALLLRLYPADFRDEMGEALIETYKDRSREALKGGNVFRLAGVWLAALRDSLRNGLGERVRPAAAWRRAGDWGRDMELAGRRLRRTPLLLAAIVGTLAIGLGTFAVVYTAVDKILLEPLPYPDPDDLYMVLGKDGRQLTGPEIAELDNAGGVIEGAVALRTNPLTLAATADADAVRLNAIFSSWKLFPLLGVNPALGRGFAPDEDGPDSPAVIILTDGLWKRLGADPAIAGSDIKLGTTLFKVLGVTPPGFRFSGSWTETPKDAYVPLYVDLAKEEPYNHNFRALIRASRGTPPEQVQLAVDAASRAVGERVYKGEDRALRAVRFQDDMVKSVRPALRALSFAVVFLLLLLTVNLASLLLARAAERERELAVSRALGASGLAIARATLIEGGLLGLAGGIAGALAGIWITRLLVTLGPPTIPRREEITLDWGVAAVVIAVGALLGLAAAAVPALWTARASLASLMSAAAVRGSAGPGRMRRGLIVVQVALSLVLLSAGGLVMRSFERLLAADPGFRPEGVLTFNVGLGTWLFPTRAESYAFQDRVDAALRALPGVTSVSSTTHLPLAGSSTTCCLKSPAASGNAEDPDGDGEEVSYIYTRAGYIKTMGMRLIAGRDFEGPPREVGREVLIDRHLAERLFPNTSPLGKTLQLHDNPITVVGVVEQARLSNLYSDDEARHLYLRGEDDDDGGHRPSYYVVRADREDLLALMTEVRTAIRQFDRRVPVSHVKTMSEAVADRRSRERISAVLMVGLGVGSLILVSMGLFGVISGSVARRRGELAVRLALGATHGRVIRLVVAEGARLVVLGVLIGIPGVDMAGKAIQGLLVDVSPFDIPTLSAVAACLVTVALLACYLAARRVTRIEPEQLLREGG
jgi:putative ABC transport system permease protein